MESSYLAQSLPRLRSLLTGLLAQGSPHIGAASSPSSSSGRRSDPHVNGTVPHAQLCEGLLKALLWVSWTSSDAADQVVEVLDDLLAKIGQMVKEHRSTGMYQTLDFYKAY